MADFGTPATPNYTAPSGITTLSDLMGLKQKQQGLLAQQLQMQGQVSQNQSLAAGAQMDTRKADEQSKLAAIPWDAFENSDGSYDVDKARKAALKVAPTSGAAFADNLATATKNAAETKKAFMSLNSDQQAQVGSVLGAWASDPKSSIDDFGQIATQRIGQAPQPVQGALAKIVNHAQQLMTTANPDGSPQTLAQQKQKAVMLSRMALSAAEQSGTGGLNTPQQGTNAAGARIVVQPTTGAISAPPGAAPGSALNPTAPQVAGATTQAVGTESQNVDKATLVSNLQKDSANAIPLTKRIDQLAKDINSGGAAKAISETGNYLGFSSLADARTELNKDLGLVKGLAIQNAGSDSRAGTILEGYPTDTTPEHTIHAAMDYIRGSARQNLARGQLLSQYQKNGNSKGFQAADDSLVRNTSPLMHEYLSLTPAEQKSFYRRNFSSPEEAQAFKNQVNAAKTHTTHLNDGQ